MAKRKHATALFEVFKPTDGQPGKPAFRLRAPRWLRGGSPDEADPTRAAAPLIAPPEPQAGPSAFERMADLTAPDPEPAAGRPGMRFSVDSHEQTINLALSYGSAAVASFALIVVIGMAYVLGRHSSRGPLPLLAEKTTDEVRQEKPRADVLDVRPESASAPITPDLSASAAPRAAPRPQNWNDPRPPTTLIQDDAHRTVGLNYVIIQSYPEQKEADGAREILIKRGILCTVEPTPANWSRSSSARFSVIGIKGFDRIRNSPEFDRYIAGIMKVSDEYAGRSRFKDFAPSAYKWREAK